ncbi:hypothetical protein HK101_006809, partial [Irineochytrium annulatum]
HPAHSTHPLIAAGVLELGLELDTPQVELVTRGPARAPERGRLPDYDGIPSGGVLDSLSTAPTGSGNDDGGGGGGAATSNAVEQHHLFAAAPAPARGERLPDYSPRQADQGSEAVVSGKVRLTLNQRLSGKRIKAVSARLAGELTVMMQELVNARTDARAEDVRRPVTGEDCVLRTFDLSAPPEAEEGGLVIGVEQEWPFLFVLHRHAPATARAPYTDLAYTVRAVVALEDGTECVTAAHAVEVVRVRELPAAATSPPSSPGRTLVSTVPFKRERATFFGSSQDGLVAWEASLPCVVDVKERDIKVDMVLRVVRGDEGVKRIDAVVAHLKELVEYR